MTYRIHLSPTALVDVGDAYTWIQEQSPDAATRWFYKLQEHIRTLEEKPRRCPLAEENKVLNLEIRVLIFGKKKGRYRILFVVEANDIHVLHIRHGSRDKMSRAELEQFDW